MAPWRRDLIFAFRRFCKSPGFVFAVVVSIGLGIGANATIFSIVRTFLLRPPAVGDPATLMSVYTIQHGDCCGNNSGHPFTVIGVAPASFRGLDIFTSDLWVPLGNKELPDAQGG